METKVYSSGETELLSFWELSEGAQEQVLKELDGDKEAAGDAFFFYSGGVLWNLGDFIRLDNDPDGWHAAAHISNTCGCRIKLVQCPYGGGQMVHWQIIG